MCTKQLWTQSWGLLDNQIYREYDFIHLPIPDKGSLAEVIDRLGAQLNHAPGYVVGFSLGGYIAGMLALQFADAIEKLMIVSNSLKALPVKEIEIRRNVLDWMEENEYRGVTSKRIAGQLHSDCAEEQSIIDCMKAMDKALGAKVFKHQLSVSTERSNILEAVCQKTIDLTFLLGNDDPLVNRRELVESVECYQVHQVLTVAQCGHMLPLEHPSAFAQALASWL